ncbi:hypothetical protein CRUP_009838 [Coryphaenoides rupestris]|nr:hypothetical protein CRUP_009838 [Coryphaenoides rupestris]
MEPMDALEAVQLYEDVKTEVVESCYTLRELTSPKKRKSRAQEDTHDKPKKPRSAYLLYYFDFHQAVQQESPSLPQSESSVSSTQDLPGFRKILPRANYIFLPKGSPSGHQAVGGSQAEPGPLVETLGAPVVEGNPSSVSLPQETQFPALALDSAVEFAEQCVTIEGLAEETMASMSEPTITTTSSSVLQGILAPSSTSCPAFLSKSSAPVACATSCGMLLATSDPGGGLVASGNSVYSVVKLKPDHSGMSGAGMLQPMKQQMSQVVTIIPAQHLVESKSVASLNSTVSQVMKVTVGCGVNKATTKPSYKMTLESSRQRHGGQSTESEHGGSQAQHPEAAGPHGPHYGCRSRSPAEPCGGGARRGQPVVTTSSLNTKGVNVLSVVPIQQNTVSTFDLGLSTARGRGRCKNPCCDYVYKNRHKPPECPKCGWELSRKGSKRHSTLLLLRRALQIPEGEAELQDTLAVIQGLNGPGQVVLSQAQAQAQGLGVVAEGEGGDTETEETETPAAAAAASGWPRYYESAATHCALCQCPLFKGGQSTIAGQEDCWLLTETLIQTASLQLKVCLNAGCLALHSFTDLHPGLFNVGNKLLVSLDLFLKIRDKLRLGHHPSEAAATVLDHIPNHPGKHGETGTPPRASVV